MARYRRNASRYEDMQARDDAGTYRPRLEMQLPTVDRISFESSTLMLFFYDRVPENSFQRRME